MASCYRASHYEGKHDTNVQVIGSYLPMVFALPFFAKLDSSNDTIHVKEWVV